MAKQSSLFHTRGYRLESAEFTAIAVKQVATGQPDDSHLIKILVSNTDTIQHTFNLSVSLESVIRDLLINVILPPNTTTSLLEDKKIGLLDSNGNVYFPLPANCHMLVDLKTSPSVGKKLVFTCICEYF